MFQTMLFAHDHVFHTHQNEVYSPGQFSVSTWRRYLAISKELIVLARRKEVAREECKRLNRSDGPHVRFSFVENSGRFRRAFGFDRELMELIRRQVTQVDAVCVRIPSLIGYLTVRACLELNKPFAVEVVGSALHSAWNHGNPLGKLYAPIADFRARWVVARSPYAIYVTHSYLQERYPQNEPVLTASASNVEVKLPEESLILQRGERILALDPGRDKVTIGVIGSLNARYKGIDYAVKAVGILREWGFDARLRILGSGSPDWLFRAIEQARLERFVHMDGLLPRGAAVEQWLDQLDVYVQPSLTEGLPRALIEAMARGLPCVGTEVGGIPELLPSSCLVPSKDAKVLAHAVRGLLLDRERMLRASLDNYEKAKTYDRNKLQRARAKFWDQFHRLVTENYQGREHLSLGMAHSALPANDKE